MLTPYETLVFETVYTAADVVLYFFPNIDGVLLQDALEICIDILL